MISSNHPQAVAEFMPEDAAVAYIPTIDDIVSLTVTVFSPPPSLSVCITLFLSR